MLSASMGEICIRVFGVFGVPEYSGSDSNLFSATVGWVGRGDQTALDFNPLKPPASHSPAGSN